METLHFPFRFKKFMMNIDFAEYWRLTKKNLFIETCLDKVDVKWLQNIMWRICDRVFLWNKKIEHTRLYILEPNVRSLFWFLRFWFMSYYLLYVWIVYKVGNDMEEVCENQCLCTLNLLRGNDPALDKTYCGGMC